MIGHWLNRTLAVWRPMTVSDGSGGCVNPEHLFLGTHDDNVADMVNKSRHPNQTKTHCPSGHPYSGDNLRLVNGKHRYCGQCRREANRRYRARKKAQQ